MSKLVVMLGNPGSQYKKTRHNAGFQFCESLVQDGVIPNSWQEKFHGLYQKDGTTIWLKPQTFMNESGISVQPVAAFFGIKPDNILVVHDDIEQEFGKVKLQSGGGLQGHNGLRSIKQQLGTDSFCRLRIGVGRPEHGDVASFVLGRFSELEEKILENSFSQAKDLVLGWLEK